MTFVQTMFFIVQHGQIYFSVVLFILHISFIIRNIEMYNNFHLTNVIVIVTFFHIKYS